MLIVGLLSPSCHPNSKALEDRAAAAKVGEDGVEHRVLRLHDGRVSVRDGVGGVIVRPTGCALRGLQIVGGAYRYREDDPHDGLSGGRYQRYRKLVDALEAVDLWLFEEEPQFFRSFAPDQWPEEGACASSSD